VGARNAFSAAWALRASRVPPVSHASPADRAVASPLDDTPIANGDDGINQIAPESPQTGENTVFVSTGEPTVTDNVGGQNGRELALRAF
jgi:hypothetical protein